MPEVIFSERKTPAQVLAAILARMAKAGGNVLATRRRILAYFAFSNVSEAELMQ